MIRAGSERPIPPLFIIYFFRTFVKGFSEQKKAFADFFAKTLAKKGETRYNKDTLMTRRKDAFHG